MTQTDERALSPVRVKSGVFPVSFAALLILGVALGLWSPVSAGGRSTAGNVSVVEVRVDGKLFQKMSTILEAPPEAIWQILTDYGRATEIFTNLKRCKVLEDKGSTKLVSHTIAPTGLPGTFQYVVKVKETAPTRIEWQRIAGAFREVDGYWALEPLDAGRATRVTYCAHINGGLFYPQPVVRRQVQMDMPQVMSNLQGEVKELKRLRIARKPEEPTR